MIVIFGAFGPFFMADASVYAACGLLLALSGLIS